jgi:hypothetical protein
MVSSLTKVSLVTVAVPLSDLGTMRQQQRLLSSRYAVKRDS